MYSDWEDVTSSARAFRVFGPATGKARLLLVDCLTGGTRRRLVPVERSDRLPERWRRTGMSGPRYGGNEEKVVLECLSVLQWHNEVTTIASI